ncbi:addiction module antidote protein [Thermodesulfobacteriota bacterium B35]
MTVKTKRFDVAEHLETPEDIKLFLKVAAEEGSPEEFIIALNTAARAVGMTEVSRRAGVTRASLYKSLSGEGDPKFSTISRITRALGCKLVVA